MTLKSYSPANMTISGDAQLITSWESVDVEYDDDRWKFSNAATGEVTRIRQESLLGTIRIVLPQTTTDNDSVNSLTTEQDSVGIGPVPPTIALNLKDNWGNSVHTISEATLIKKPKAEFSKDPKDREWVFKGELNNHKVGGNE